MLFILCVRKHSFSILWVFSGLDNRTLRVLNKNHPFHALNLIKITISVCISFKEAPTDHYMRPYYIASSLERRKWPKLCSGAIPRHKVMMNYIKDVN